MGKAEKDQRPSGVTVHGDNSGPVTVGTNNLVVIGDHCTVTKYGVREPVVRRRGRPSGGAPQAGEPGELSARDDELAELEDLAAAGVPVQLVGPAGIGKTALLERFAADRVAAGRDVVFLDGADCHPEDIRQKLFEACYDAGTDYRPTPERLAKLMRSVRVPVIVDGFTGTSADLHTLVRLLPSASLIVSSTARRAWSRGRTLRLSGLGPGPARALVERELGRPLSEHEGVAVEEFRDVVDGHPLALIQAAAAMGVTDQGVPGDPHELALALATGLGPQDHAVLGVLLCLEGIAVPADVVELLSGTAALAESVDRLRRAHLVEQRPRGLRALLLAARLVAESARPRDGGFDAATRRRDSPTGRPVRRHGRSALWQPSRYGSSTPRWRAASTPPRSAWLAPSHRPCAGRCGGEPGGRSWLWGGRPPRRRVRPGTSCTSSAPRRNAREPWGRSPARYSGFSAVAASSSAVVSPRRSP
ncbi:ATP-binding protein [Streptomyces sp. LN245]|uniref:ATP-binding protein n=1 Tax=Streptomyces sp. LN245 TaxID=3112975 RepID=UPI0037167F2E